MVLVDTSIWVDHLAKSHPVLRELLLQKKVRMHPFVLGEIAVGSLKDRDLVLGELEKLRAVRSARNEEVMRFLSVHKLFGSGIGYLDAHLLASAKLTPGTTLWTRDKRLHAAALALSIAFEPLLN